MLEQDEEQRRQRLPAQVHRRDDGLADETAQRLHLVLDHGRHFRRFDTAEMRQRKTQDVVEQVVAQAAQHALPHPALHGVDLELDPAADDDQRQKGQRQREQVRCTLKRESIKNMHHCAAQQVGQGEAQAQERGGRVRARKSLPLYRLVDDGLGQVQ